jgi:hypothetical protein
LCLGPELAHCVHNKTLMPLLLLDFLHSWDCCSG